MQKVPFLLVAGDREKEAGSLAVRSRSGEDLGSMNIDDLGKFLAEHVAKRGRSIMED
jgi:threonyl-tRNA synthetase